MSLKVLPTVVHKEDFRLNDIVQWYHRSQISSVLYLLQCTLVTTPQSAISFSHIVLPYCTISPNRKVYHFPTGSHTINTAHVSNYWQLIDKKRNEEQGIRWLIISFDGTRSVLLKGQEMGSLEDGEASTTTQLHGFLLPNFFHSELCLPMQT